jgi:phosphoadenosine phosphosulfate reductase
MLDLDAINPILETKTPQQIVEWSFGEFGKELVMSSSFGAESAVLLHLATRVYPDIKIIMVDTGYLFPETWQFMNDLRLKWNLNVWVYHTTNDPIAYLQRAGEDDFTWRKDIDSCCGINKNEPMERAMRELKPKAWLRGIKRTQSEARKDRHIVEWSKRYDCYAVSPLLNLTGKTTYEYMKANGLPWHPLYEKGYTSIGCNPLSCTRPIMPGEDPRAGRWSAQNKLECGINLDSAHSVDKGPGIPNP